MTHEDFAERIVRILAANDTPAIIHGPFVKTKTTALGGSTLAQIEGMATEAGMGWVITSDATGNLQILY